LHESRPRNPRIARVLYCRKLFESWGGGIELVDTLCQQAGNPAPEFFERSGGFCVRLLFKESMEPVQIKTAESASYKLNLRQIEVLELLKQDGLLSVSEIHSKLSKPAAMRTLTGDLSLLQSHGLIESQGHGRSTRWKLRQK
jgi:ATP-dependent DNA helicase RecG